MRSSPRAPDAVPPAGPPAAVALRLHGIGPELPPAASMLRLLDDVERSRAVRIEPAHSTSFIAGRYLLRLFVADLLGVQAELLASRFTCPVCGPDGVPDHGRPEYLLDDEQVPLALSLSRAGGFVLLGALDPRASGPGGVPGAGSGPAGATGPGAGRTPHARLGVDLAAVTTLDFGGFDAVALTPEELLAVGALPVGDQGTERARLWTRKEALVKALGTGFTDRDPGVVEVLHDRRIGDLQSVDGVPLEPLGLVAALAVIA